MGEYAIGGSIFSYSTPESVLLIVLVVLVSVLFVSVISYVVYYLWRQYQRRIQQFIDEDEGNYMGQLQELRRITIVPVRSRLNISVLSQQPSFYATDEENITASWSGKNKEQPIWSTPFQSDPEDTFSHKDYYHMYKDFGVGTIALPPNLPISYSYSYPDEAKTAARATYKDEEDCKSSHQEISSLHQNNASCDNGEFTESYMNSVDSEDNLIVNSNTSTLQPETIFKHSSN